MHNRCSAAQFAQCLFCAVACIDDPRGEEGGYCTQEKKGTGDAQIFELFWEPEHTQVTSGTSAAARDEVKWADARGFSGSLVWNTRYLEFTGQGLAWSPEDAVVSGLLRRWDEDTKTLLAWRVEHLKTWLTVKGF